MQRKRPPKSLLAVRTHDPSQQPQRASAYSVKPQQRDCCPFRARSRCVHALDAHRPSGGQPPFCRPHRERQLRSSAFTAPGIGRRAACARLANIDREEWMVVPGLTEP